MWVVAGTRIARQSCRKMTMTVQPQTARHNRVAREVAIKEPEVRCNVELSDHMAFAVQATVTGNIGDPIHHQHWRGRQLSVSRAKQLAPRALQKILFVKAVWIVGHLGMPLFEFNSMLL